MADYFEEKRRFKRYKKETVFVLNLSSGSYRCKTIDYSADGISLQFIDSKPTLSPGNIVQIKIKDPKIELQGEVVWTRESGKDLIAGFRRVDNIKGYCQDFQLPDILLGIQRSMKTGNLVLITGVKVINVLIKDGDVLFARSNQEGDRLGVILLKKGAISLEQYFEAGEQLKKTDTRFGKVLIDLGLITPAELLKAIQEQLEDIVISLFTTECGYFEFKEKPVESEETITLRLSAANIIYRGTKQIRDFHYILENIPPLDTVVSLSPNPADLFQDISLDENDGETLSLIRGNITLRDILKHSRMNDYETVRTIYALMSAKIIVFKKKDEPPSPVCPEDVICEHHAGTDPEFIGMINDMYSSYSSISYYELFGVNENVPAGEIKKAYFRLAKEFHPDRHFSISSEGIKQKLNEIFSHINTSYKVLSDPGKRKEYNRTLLRKAPRLNSDLDESNARFKEGRTMLFMKNFPEAEKLFAQAIYLDSSRASYHYYQGLCLRNLNRLKDAARAFEQAIALDPVKAHYHSNLGLAYLDLGFKKRAVSAFKKALSISPSDETALKGLRQASPRT